MKTRIAAAVAVAVSLAVSVVASVPASAQSAEDLVRSLAVHPGAIFQSQPGTNRRLVVPPKIVLPAQPTAPVFTPGELRVIAGGPVAAADRKRITAAIAAYDLPSVDMEVFFAYDSAALLPSAHASLSALGQALVDPRLYGETFLIAGHTDATGSAAYNQGLSERRAWSVKHFLVSNFGIDPQTLIAVGYGEEQLKDWYNPASGVNRRVQIVNLATR